jgi:hypothetical protein
MTTETGIVKDTALLALKTEEGSHESRNVKNTTLEARKGFGEKAFL